VGGGKGQEGRRKTAKNFKTLSFFGLRQDGDSGGDTVDLAYIKHYIEDILPKNFDNDHRLLNLFLLQL